MFPTLFNFYLADMHRPTEPVKRICYTDDITVWASGGKIGRRPGYQGQLCSTPFSVDSENSDRKKTTSNDNCPMERQDTA